MGARTTAGVEDVDGDELITLQEVDNCNITRIVRVVAEGGLSEHVGEIGDAYRLPEFADFRMDMARPAQPTVKGAFPRAPARERGDRQGRDGRVCEPRPVNALKGIGPSRRTGIGPKGRRCFLFGDQRARIKGSARGRADWRRGAACRVKWSRRWGRGLWWRGREA